MDRPGCSRRSFLLQTLATGVAGAATAAPAGARDKGGPYIDVHTHIGRTWNGHPGLSADALVKWMDAHHVAKAVVLPLVSPESSSYLNLTEQALEAAQKHPARLVPFCCIDPRTSYEGGRTGLRAMLKEYVDQGAKGFGEHKAGLSIDDPRMKALYEVCEDLRLPVLFHMDGQRGIDKPGLPGLESVLKSFPTVPFIGHGPGFWASISGDANARDLAGYPRGAVKSGGALDRLFDGYPNLWGDLSAGSGAGALSRDREFGRRFLMRRADRLLFGSDYLRPGQDVPQFELLASLELPPESRARIERGNAMRLLGLKL
jgi:predicted TIM-barrel fold metal-dependent hydrolase